jgi:hypothetical protein
VRFEITRLDEVGGDAADRTVVDAADIGRLVREAAESGQRIYIRPAD